LFFRSSHLRFLSDANDTGSFSRRFEYRSRCFWVPISGIRLGRNLRT
jgi:hypothetical protein